MTDCLISMFKEAQEKFVQAQWLWEDVGPIGTVMMVDPTEQDRIIHNTSVAPSRAICFNPFPIQEWEGDRREQYLFAPVPELPPLEIQEFKLVNLYERNPDWDPYSTSHRRIDGPSLRAIKEGDQDSFVHHELKSYRKDIRTKWYKGLKGFWKSSCQKERALLRHHSYVHDYLHRETLAPKVYRYLRYLYEKKKRAFEFAETLEIKVRKQRCQQRNNKEQP